MVCWIVEQNVIESLADHPKVIQLPTGLCAARLYPDDITYHSNKRAKTDSGQSTSVLGKTITPESTNVPGRNNVPGSIKIPENDIVSESTNVLGSKNVSETLSFHQRSSRVFFCFHTRYYHRQMYMQYALMQCTICDVCIHPNIDASARASTSISDSSTSASGGGISTSGIGDTSTKDISSSSSSLSQLAIPTHLRHTLPIRALWKAYAQVTPLLAL